ncbi:M20/M25/M40 family metallo-hydrolase [Heyndrickxia coagulans]|uniref:M20/M25/M40 family metallo-hydrolase n=1 Tax=Heyndrickxia coagulans TaxID=1398 RepID=UPI003D2FD980
MHQNPELSFQEVETSQFIYDTLASLGGLALSRPIQDGVPTMGGEDFSGFQQKAPGTFFFIGAGNADKGIVYPHHHARFTVDEDVLPYGVKAFVAASLTLTA